VTVCGNAVGLLGSAGATCGSLVTPPVTPPAPPVEPPAPVHPPIAPPTAPNGPGHGVSGSNVHQIAGSSGLAVTGTDVHDMAALALLMLMLGSLALLVGARRREV
jgi:hypothetical protein